ncbi:hypothetical protein KAS45_05645 [candidate division WOR-3 bacterium]|nr:hypothetical protein [candidate division WOR-3 bacterium]
MKKTLELSDTVYRIRSKKVIMPERSISERKQNPKSRFSCRRIMQSSCRNHIRMPIFSV